MTIQTIKMSQFASAGDLSPNEVTIGINSGENVQYNNPLPLLPPGTTAERPIASPGIYYRLRFNTTLDLYEYYSPTITAWFQLADTSGAEAPFLLYTEDAEFPEAFNLGLLGSGILKQTVTSGISTPAIASLNTDYYGPGMTAYLQAPPGVKDITGNVIVDFSTAGASSVNYINLVNSLTTQSVALQALGSDTNIGIHITPKGSGVLNLDGLNWPISDGTSGEVLTTDGSGNLTFQSTGSGVTPAPLTVSSTSNVTITLSGTPATALLQPVLITLGWTGQLGLSLGGTNANLTANNGGIVYSTASALGILAGTATARQILQSGTSTTPAWSTATYPSTTTINKLLYSSSNNVVAELGVGTGLAISGGNLTATGTGFITWNSVSVNTNMVVNNGYIANSLSTNNVYNFTLPVTAAVGSLNVVTSIGTPPAGFPWVILQNSGQSIYFDSQITTIGTGGNLTSTNYNDTVWLLCVVANTTWVVISAIGNLTVT